MKRLIELFSLPLIFCLAGLAGAEPLGTAFTYQGNLQQSGVPANGAFDFQFALFEFDVGGFPITVPIFLEDVGVADGAFTVGLDFGPAPFAGERMYLEIGVREGASVGDITILLPRQELTPVPYALHAEMVAMSAVGSNEVDRSEVQLRIAESCPPGHHVRSIGEDGSVDCEADADTINTDASNITSGILDASRYNAYENLALGGRLNVDDDDDLMTRRQSDNRYRSGTVAVPATAWVPDSFSNCTPYRDKFWFYFEAGSGSDCRAFVPLDLPDGVVVTSLSCAAYDNDSAAGRWIDLLLCQVEEAGAGCTSAPRSDDSGVQEISTSFTLTVDNNSYNYQLEAQLGFSPAVGSGLSLSGCRLTYVAP